MEKIKGMCRNEACEFCDEIFEVEKTDFRCPHCGKELFPMGDVPDDGGTKKGPNWKIIAGAVAAVAVLGGGAFFAFSGGDKDNGGGDEPTTITLSKQTASISVGKNDTLTAIVTPDGATCTLKWASNNPEVAKVDNGIVTFIAEGDVKIGVQVNEKPELKAFCEYKVKKEDKGGNPGRDTLNWGWATYKGDIKNGKPHGNGVIYFNERHAILNSSQMAEKGEHVTGQFRDGKLILGTLVQKNGNEVIVK